MNRRHFLHAVGSLLFSAAALAAPHAQAAPAGERVEISSPIFPKTSVLYAREGGLFPSTLAEEEAMAHDASLTFEPLLLACQPSHPAITLATASSSPTPAELITNYSEVAKCAYETYTAKPYWIPQLVSDVDICGAELGSDWALPTEADLASFTEADFLFIADTLTGAATGTSNWGTFYFSLGIFVRAADGSIQKGDLRPGAAVRVEPLPVTGDDLKRHYEGGLALRCIRRTPLQ